MREIQVCVYQDLDYKLDPCQSFTLGYKIIDKYGSVLKDVD